MMGLWRSTRGGELRVQSATERTLRVFIAFTTRILPFRRIGYAVTKSGLGVPSISKSFPYFTFESIFLL